jgi:hypothetical protein
MMIIDVITEEVCFLFIKGLPDKNKIIRFNATQEVKKLTWQSFINRAK